MKFRLPIVNHSLTYNPSIDGLRGIAVFLVLLFHIWPNIFSFGYVGVDIFFVISGFLITQIIYIKIQNGNFSFREFYRNRIRRIFPALIVVLCFAFIVGYLFLLPNELKELGSHIQYSSFFLENFRLARDIGYWDKASELKPLLHFWSLSIEEQFYLFWPLVLLSLYKIRANILVFLSVVFLILFVMPIAIDINRFYNTLSRAFELCFGGLCFVTIYKHKFLLEKIANFKNLIYFLFFASIMFSYKNYEFNTFKTSFLVFATGLLLIILYENPQKSFFKHYIFVFLGLISYPLYLWHYVFISYGHIFNINVPKYGLLIIIISLISSYLTYIFIEIYARKQKSYKFASLLFLTVVCIGIMGLFVKKSDGLPNRIFFTFDMQEFIRTPSQNDLGISLIQKILGYKPNNDYIKATSDDLNKRYILVTGDSHAHSSYPGLEDMFKSKGFEIVLFANSSCPPYIGGGG